MNPLYGYFGDDLSPAPPYESQETGAGILRCEGLVRNSENAMVAAIQPLPTELRERVFWFSEMLHIFSQRLQACMQR